MLPGMMNLGGEPKRLTSADIAQLRAMLADANRGGALGMNLGAMAIAQFAAPFLGDILELLPDAVRRRERAELVAQGEHPCCNNCESCARDQLASDDVCCGRCAERRCQLC